MAYHLPDIDKPQSAARTLIQRPAFLLASLQRYVENPSAIAGRLTSVVAYSVSLITAPVGAGVVTAQCVQGFATWAHKMAVSLAVKKAGRILIGTRDAAHVRDRGTARMGSGTDSRVVTALRILIAGAIGLLLYYAHVAFVPIALALLVALVLSGPVEMLHGMGVPRSASALILMLGLLGIVAGLSDLLYAPAQHWFAEAPHTIKLIEKKVRPMAQFVERIDDLRNSAGNLGAATHASTQPSPPAASAEESAPLILLTATRGIVLSTITVLILTLFLLAGGPPMLARMTTALVSDLNAAHVIGVIEKVRSEVGRFYVTTALINIGLGLATGCVMRLCGMPNPFLWGTVAGLLNFIPYAGPTVTAILLTLVAVVSFDGLGRVLVVTGSFLGLVLIEGQIIQPLLIGRRLQLNPMLVFLGLWFGGLFWGIAGIVLATPTLVALKVIAKQADNGKPVLDFLSPELSAEPPLTD